MSFTPEPRVVNQFWRAYRQLGGAHERPTFEANLQKFFDLTFKAYIHGEGDRQEAWTSWMVHMQNETFGEARRYFVAIDTVCPYT